MAAVLATSGCAVTALADPADRPPVLLLVRLHPRLPNGAVVGESLRVCHLVPVPRPDTVPAVLSAYCGVVIAPGTAELLTTISGMPCEPCLARSPIPAFTLLRGLPTAPSERDAGWWERGLPSEQQVTAVLVVLYLLKSDRPVTLSELVVRLGVDSATVNLVLLRHETAGWVSRIPAQTEEPLAEPRYRLTDDGRTAAPQLLARSQTPALTERAARLGLSTTRPGPW
jgi:DNA-binding MarR family transcriptional regulator